MPYGVILSPSPLASILPSLNSFLSSSLATSINFLIQGASITEVPQENPKLPCVYPPKALQVARPTTPSASNP